MTNFEFMDRLCVPIYYAEVFECAGISMYGSEKMSTDLLLRFGFSGITIPFVMRITIIKVANRFGNGTTRF
jgi:hypothetical protein